MVVRRVLAVSYQGKGTRLLGVVVDRTDAPVSRRKALSVVRRMRGTRKGEEAAVRPARARSGPVINGTIALLIGPA